MPRCRRSFVIAAICVLAWACSLAVAQSADALFARLEAAAADTPRTGFDPAAVVVEVGSEPEALFAWVRDRVGFVAYRGALKGAAGTLLDGGGNALDRALLLRALLAEAGHDSALAHATLAPEVAARVVAAVRTPTAAAPASADFAALAARAEAELGVDGAAVATELERLAADAAARRTELEARAADAAAALLALVGAGPSADPAVLVADHWWVAWRTVDGTLVDLDPTLPDAAPGDRLAEAAGLVAPTAVAQLAALEGGCRDLTCGDRLHTVRVGAIAEVVEDGVLVEYELLDHELLPADLLGVPLALMVASDGDEDLDPFATVAPAEALHAALLERGAWQPVLRVGADEVRGRAVTAAGVVQDSLSGGSGGGALGGFGGGFGGGLGGGGDAADGFTALWWTFEVRTPGVGVVVERRTLFDRLGAAARAAGAPADEAPAEAARLARALALGGQTELALSPAAPSDALLEARAAARLLAERDAWSALYEGGTALPMAAVNERLVALGNLRTPLERLALERGRGAAPQTGLFVVAHHTRLRPDLTTDQGFDLIASPGAGDEGFAARVGAGARDAVLEALLAGGGDALADAFRGAPAGWVALHDAAGGVALDLGSADLAARVVADLAAGFVVVVPVGSATGGGWWRVDPTTGATVAMGDRGWGQAMAGYAEQTNVVLQLRTVVNQYASMGQCLGMAISQPLQGVTGVGEELAECVFNLVCGQVHTALSNIPSGDPNWTTIIIQNTIDALWGGVPEARSGSFCGSLWSRLKGG